MPGTNSPDNPLTPRELDLLEDAVEAITQGEDWEWPEDIGPHVRARFAAYRQILDVYRAIALEQVPPGLLDPLQQQLNQLPREQVSWLRALVARLRRSQLALPTLTVVATVALVLWVAEPTVSQHVFAVAPEPAAEAVENMRIQPSQPRPTTEATRPGAVTKIPTTANVDVLETSPSKASKSALGGGRGGKKSKRTATNSRDIAAALAKAEDVQAPAPVTDKDLLRSELERADKLRRKGACTQASAIYREVSTGARGTQRARALAGLSLCAEFEGHSVGAEQYMQQARAITAIDAWAAGEREAMDGSKIQAAKTDD